MSTPFYTCIIAWICKNVNKNIDLFVYKYVVCKPAEFDTDYNFFLSAYSICADRPLLSTDDRYEIKSKGLVRLIYQSCGWDRTRSYRLPGVEYPQHRLVNYDLSRAIPIFEGRIDKETQEAQKEELL